LGLGVLSVAPSQAAVSGYTLTVDANDTISTGESATAVVTQNFFATSTNDSTTVAAVVRSGGSSVGSVRVGVSDSFTSAVASGGAVTNVFTQDTQLGAVVAGGTPSALRTSKITHRAGADGVSATAKYSVVLYNVSAAGTYYVDFYSYSADTGAASIGSVATWTVTVTAADTKPASSSIAAVRQHSTVASDLTSTSVLGGTAATTDSSTVAAKSSTSTSSEYIVYVLQNNATATANESITAVVSGNAYISASNARGTTTALTLKNVANTYVPIYVFSNGTAGTATLTIQTPSYAFPAKTLKFSGIATKVAVSTAVSTKKIIRTTAGTSTSNVAILSVTDAAGVALTGSQTFTVTSSDVTQIGSATVGAYDATLGGYPLTTVTSNAAVSGKAVTLTISIADPADATGVAKLTTTHAVTMGGVVAKEVISFDKASYSAGEQMIITVTGTDASGNPVYDGASAPTLASNKSLGGSSALTTYKGGKATTGSFDSDGSVINAYTVYAPSTAGEFKVTATGTDASGTTQLSATASVSDAAIDAATDAAAEATDAANAATDAALAAADAADAATAAAQDASDAVAALSASVSKLISSLRAQITSLTNLVIKIQKKVKA